MSTYTETDLFDAVYRVAAELGAEEGLMAPEATLVNVGLDSLDVVELSQALKKQLNVAITPKDFAEAETFADAVNVLKAALASPAQV